MKKIEETKLCANIDCGKPFTHMLPKERFCSFTCSSTHLNQQGLGSLHNDEELLGSTVAVISANDRRLSQDELMKEARTAPKVLLDRPLNPSNALNSEGPARRMPKRREASGRPKRTRGDNGEPLKDIHCRGCHARPGYKNDTTHFCGACWDRWNEARSSAEVLEDHALRNCYACLRGESLVQLGDGSWKKIRDMVRRKYAGEVRALVDGQVKNCKVTGWRKSFNRGQTWIRLKTDTSRLNNKGVTGPVFAPYHEIVTPRGMMRVDQLELGVTRIITNEKLLSADQRSVVLGSLLGDGGLTRRNSAKCGFHFSQNVKRADYARWKAETLGSVMTFKSCRRKNQYCYEGSYCQQLVDLESQYPRHDSETHSDRMLVVSPELLDVLGPLGLAVWYQDDGVFTKDKVCRIICTKLTVPEQQTAERWLGDHFGGGYYDSNQGALMFSRKSSKAFLAHIAGYIHPCVGYKADVAVGANLPDVVTESGELFSEIIQETVEARRSENAGHDTRFCLTVPEAGNFLTKVGFVSSCRGV